MEHPCHQVIIVAQLDEEAELQPKKADKGRTLSDLHDRLNDEQATSEEALLLSKDHWDSVETFLARVNGVLKDLRDMESLLEEIKIKHSQILIEPGVHPQFTDELNRATESFKVKSYATQTAVRPGRNMPDEDIDKAIESGQLFDYTKGLILAQRDKRALYDEVKSRHEDIIRLEASIRELHDLFQDMSMLLESQGEMLNHIERNVESAVDYATKAYRNVKQAKEIQTSARKDNFCGVKRCGVELESFSFVHVTFQNRFVGKIECIK
uniref:t-SNARE coiled-coil homology domain-containing protein n=1 Tax=Ascaris lumbricoides TaxID=6252 RepID=A0A9J2PVH0_ASCLU